MVADQLQALLEETNALNPFQSRLRMRHGIETELVTLQDDLLREADKGKMSLLVLLNLSIAFDTVDHSMLLGRHSGLGRWRFGFAFLEDCPHRVQFGEMLSAP